MTPPANLDQSPSILTGREPAYALGQLGPITVTLATPPDPHPEKGPHVVTISRDTEALAPVLIHPQAGETLGRLAEGAPS